MDNACLFDRRLTLYAYDAEIARGAANDSAVSAALETARASNPCVTEGEVREWLARALAARRLALRKRRAFKLVQGAAGLQRGRG
jgi:hypothetical protein